MSGTSGGGRLASYVAMRLVLAIPMIIVLLTLVILLMRVAPGDPIQAALGGHLTPEQLSERRAAAGYDRSLMEQYFIYFGEVFSGNLGKSVTDGRTVGQILAENGLPTLVLTVASLIVALIIGLPLGILSGRFQSSGLDTGVRIFGIVTYAAPVFFIGLLAQLFFGVYLGWLPTSGQASPLVQALVEPITNVVLFDAIAAGDWDAIKDALIHLVLPSVTLGLLVSGVLIRLLRVNMIQTLKSDYIEAATARGISGPRIVLAHGFRNAMVPVITVMGLQVAMLLGGAVLTEQTFNWPGIGSVLVQYLNNRDYAAVQGIITVFALVVVAISVLIDVITGLIDPRVRFG